VLDNAAELLLGARQEARHVDEGDDRDVEGVAEAHEARALAGAVDVDRLGAVDEPFLELFRLFLDTYIGASGDEELLDVLPPFLAFRGLVLAHPRWYPDLTNETRAALLRFADRLAAGSRLSVDGIVSALA